jgi:hypothetical protein
MQKEKKKRKHLKPKNQPETKTLPKLRFVF